MTRQTMAVWVPVTEPDGWVRAIARVALDRALLSEIEAAAEQVETAAPGNEGHVLVAPIVLVRPQAAATAFARLADGGGMVHGTECVPPSELCSAALVVSTSGVAIEVEVTRERTITSKPVPLARLQAAFERGGEFAAGAFVPPAVEDLVERMKAEILADIADGRVPATVYRFCDLHEHVDANEYGGACVEPWAAHSGAASSATVMDLLNGAQSAVDMWLRAGRPMAGAAPTSSGASATPTL